PYPERIAFVHGTGTYCLLSSVVRRSSNYTRFSHECPIVLCFVQPFVQSSVQQKRFRTSQVSVIVVLATKSSTGMSGAFARSRLAGKEHVMEAGGSTRIKLGRGFPAGTVIALLAVLYGVFLLGEGALEGRPVAASISSTSSSAPVNNAHLVS